MFREEPLRYPQYVEARIDRQMPETIVGLKSKDVLALALSSNRILRAAGLSSYDPDFAEKVTAALCLSPLVTRTALGQPISSQEIRPLASQIAVFDPVALLLDEFHLLPREMVVDQFQKDFPNKLPEIQQFVGNEIRPVLGAITTFDKPKDQFRHEIDSLLLEIRLRGTTPDRHASPKMTAAATYDALVHVTRPNQEFPLLSALTLAVLPANFSWADNTKTKNMVINQLQIVSPELVRSLNTLSRDSQNERFASALAAEIRANSKQRATKIAADIIFPSKMSALREDLVVFLLAANNLLPENSGEYLRINHEALKALGAIE